MSLSQALHQALYGPLARDLTDPGVGGGDTPYSPLSLFASGEQGAWYDPSDFTTMFQDAAGTTPVTAVEQSVGLVLDKSQGLVLGSELVANGTFDAGTTGWVADNSASLSVVGQKLRVQHDGGNYPLAVYDISTVAGKTYRIHFSVTRGTSPNGIGLRAFNLPHVAGGAQLGDSGYKAASGDYVCVFKAVSSTSHIYFIVNTETVGTYDDVDNVSIRELSGNHAFQITAASRSVLRGAYYLDADGVNDSLAAATGGGASTHALIVMGFRVGAIGAAQTLFSDRTGNTGLKLEVTAGGNIAFSGGNGAAIVTATGAAVSAATDYVVTAHYNGTNLSVQLNNGTATTAACVLSAGTAGVTLMKDSGAATGYHGGRQYGVLYTKDRAMTTGEIASGKAYMATKSGVTL